MPGSHSPYPPEFRQQMVELVRAGRTPQELAAEFEPTAESIRNWVKQAARDDDTILAPRLSSVFGIDKAVPITYPLFSTPPKQKDPRR